MTPAVEVVELRKSFQRQTGWRDYLARGKQRVALNGVSFSVAPGEVFGLLGPNGAGKTTLIKVIAGLVLPDAGSARVLGFDVAAENLEVRRRIGVVHGDERSFFWRLSARENLRFYADLYGIRGRPARRRIDELLELVGMEEAADQRMFSFSSGMRQRTAIARGLMNDPKVIILDEPTRSLDPLGAEDFHQLLLERVAADGRTVLIATHSMGEAELVCDRVTLIERGSTALTGTVDDFRTWVRDDVIYEILAEGAGIAWERDLLLVPGVADVRLEQREPGLTWIQLRMNRRAGALPTVIRYLVERRTEIRSCEKHEPSLEETFREIVRGRMAATAEVSR